ncbi:autoinducer synthesis protein RhlI [Pseudomonas aeruginosa]|nr:autoinducer synthesis protein RhlI [Pseudomonas aeruginosa]
MIELLSESLEGLSAAMIAELGRYRHQVFIEKLGWDVVSTSRVRDQEFDQFDHPQTRYIVAMGRQGICGCARLLPTTDAYPAQGSLRLPVQRNPAQRSVGMGAFALRPPARRTIRNWR